MNIWIVGGDREKRELWGSLLANSLSSTTVSIGMDPELFINRADTDNDIVICLTTQFDNKVQKSVDHAIASEIPILCILEKIVDSTFDRLIEKGIKGVIDGNIASLDTIKKAIRIVKRGGSYIEAPVKYKKRNPNLIKTQSIKPVLDMTEWRVFSLTSKGLTIKEIANQLGISESTATSYQEGIIEKTKSKTLSGAVASGINEGWLKNIE